MPNIEFTSWFTDNPSIVDITCSSSHVVIYLKCYLCWVIPNLGSHIHVVVPRIILCPGRVPIVVRTVGSSCSIVDGYPKTTRCIRPALNRESHILSSKAFQVVELGYALLNV